MSMSPASDGRISHSSDPGSLALNSRDHLAAAGPWVDEDEDDDIDIELASGDTDDSEFFDPSEEAEGDYHDANDGTSDVEIELSPGDSTNQPSEERRSTEENVATETPEPGGRPRLHIPGQILQLLGRRGLQQLLAQRYSAASDSPDLAEDDVNVDGQDSGPETRRKTRASRVKNNRLPPVPNEEGRRLMDHGVFGASPAFVETLRQKKPKLANKILQRELGLSKANSVKTAGSVAQDLLPSSTADQIIHYGSRCYSGQFSDDGNFFFSCAQDFSVRMYDTSNPYKWKYYKTVVYPYGQWTITDATLSPDNRYLAYSSIRSTVCLSPTDPGSLGEPYLLDFADTGSARAPGRRWQGYSHFGIWSLRFSGDGREIVAGTSGPSVCVFDIERQRSIINIEDGHSEDVNAVCFGDKHSPHILYSGSDDTLIKVWDRRSLGDGRAAGVFLGHTEGLTYVDSKGDGRYVLSNGKDQTMKLWDLRKMMSTAEASQINPTRYTTGFDYRFMTYSPDQYSTHPHDRSLVTFRGHSVLKTLIRCHFSPPGSTNSRYVYSGSEDGSVYIYNMDATLAGKIDVNKATIDSKPKDANARNNYYIDDRRDRHSWKTCVRDASWHPNAPVLAATSWNGWGMSTGTCTVHSWDDGAEDDEGSPKMGQSVDEKLRPDKNEESETPSGAGNTRDQWARRLRSQRVVATNDDDYEDVW